MELMSSTGNILFPMPIKHCSHRYSEGRLHALKHMTTDATIDFTTN